jgi:hypothetical protein
MLAVPFSSRILTVNVLGLVCGQAADGELSVGGLGGAITTGQIVDDQSGNLITGHILDGVLDNVDLLTGVAKNFVRFDNEHRSQINLHPHKGTNVSNLGGLGSESRISHSSSSRADLG